MDCTRLQERRKLSPALFNATAKDVWSVFAQCGVGVLPVRAQQNKPLPAFASFADGHTRH